MEEQLVATTQLLGTFGFSTFYSKLADSSAARVVKTTTVSRILPPRHAFEGGTVEALLFTRVNYSLVHAGFELLRMLICCLKR